MIRRRYPLSLFLVVLFLLATATSLILASPTIQLTVDTTQAPERIIRTHEIIPVKSGPLTLFYPKWIPGEHEPSGPIANVAGLKFTAHGKNIPWNRDLLDVFTFHVEVPEGVSTLDIEFQYLEPGGRGGQYTSGTSATHNLVDLSWNQNLLYLAGVPAQDQMFHATLVLPAGWKFGTALPVENQTGSRITFQSVELNRLVDSPVIAGKFYRAIDITPPGESIHHEIDLVADSAEALEMTPQVEDGLKNLVAETGKLFGARHYRDYHFLLTLSDFVAHFGLEHHESNDSRVGERTLIGPNASRQVGPLLAHEFTHSWNGKFRRPADLSTPYYEVPEKTDMLWVYEGFTDFFGNVLAARSGLWTEEDYHRYIAGVAASLGPGRPGRTWRALQDTDVAVPGMFGQGGWMNWRRGTDYYPEGDLIWLQAATIIDRVTHGQKSIDDFCKLFYGGPNEGPQLKPYTFEQLVETLNQVAPYDWAKLLHERLDSTAPEAPIEGLEASGWKVIYNDKPTEEPRPRITGGVIEPYSIGLTVSPAGDVIDSTWDGPAFNGGVTPGMKILGVNGRLYNPDRLKLAIKESAKSAKPIELLVGDNSDYKICTVNYHGGERYPHLERIEGTPEYLDSNVLKARVPHIEAKPSPGDKEKRSRVTGTEK
ncbi:MAG: M61 family peptidase [Acidobacteriia bacterium]|nr:M61 family peptidase [Terriglobia bacterium]